MSNDVKADSTAKKTTAAPATTELTPPAAANTETASPSSVTAEPASVDISEVTREPEAQQVAFVGTAEEAEETDDVDYRSDGLCPLQLSADGPSALSQKRVTQNIGQATIVHREPTVRLVDPVACPNCDKLFERHSLVTNTYGEKDCAAAMNEKQRPENKAFFDAYYSGDAKQTEIEAKRLGAKGEALLRVFSPTKG